GALLDDPAHVAGDLHRLGLRRELKAKLHGGADRERRRRHQIKTAQRDVPGLRDLLLALEQNLDLQLAIVPGIDSPKVLGQGRSSFFRLAADATGNDMVRQSPTSGPEGPLLQLKRWNVWANRRVAGGHHRIPGLVVVDRRERVIPALGPG